MNETKSHEEAIASSWYHGVYDMFDARLSCELQGLNFRNVEQFYGEIYAEAEAISNG
jgi:hypothetical protein